MRVNEVRVRSAADSARAALAGARGEARTAASGRLLVRRVAALLRSLLEGGDVGMVREVLLGVDPRLILPVLSSAVHDVVDSMGHLPVDELRPVVHRCYEIERLVLGSDSLAER